MTVMGQQQVQGLLHLQYTRWRSAQPHITTQPPSWLHYFQARFCKQPVTVWHIHQTDKRLEHGKRKYYIHKLLTDNTVK